jgi:hypothetical protein
MCFNIFIYGYDFMNVNKWEWWNKNQNYIHKLVMHLGF